MKLPGLSFEVSEGGIAIHLRHRFLSCVNRQMINNLKPACYHRGGPDGVCHPWKVRPWFYAYIGARWGKMGRYLMRVRDRVMFPPPCVYPTNTASMHTLLLTLSSPGCTTEDAQTNGNSSTPRCSAESSHPLTPPPPAHRRFTECSFSFLTLFSEGKLSEQIKSSE